MTILEVQNLSQSYGGLHVLNNVSFSIQEGERVGLIGPNGAGKTTLMNVLNGLLLPTAGRVSILGREVTRMSSHRRILLGLGRSFQLNMLFFNLSLLDNVLTAIFGTRTSRFQMFRPVSAYGDALNKVKELLEPTGLWEKRNITVNELSYGEQRQVEVLLALASKPKLFLLDEPSTGLTTGEISKLLNMIRELTKDVTLFFVGHDMDLVFALADRIMVLYYGQIIAQGTPKQIQSNPRVKEIYLGTGDKLA